MGYWDYYRGPYATVIGIRSPIPYCKSHVFEENYSLNPELLNPKSQTLEPKGLKA